MRGELKDMMRSIMEFKFLLRSNIREKRMLEPTEFWECALQANVFPMHLQNRVPGSRASRPVLCTTVSDNLFCRIYSHCVVVQGSSCTTTVSAYTQVGLCHSEVLSTCRDDSILAIVSATDSRENKKGYVNGLCPKNEANTKSNTATKKQ
jgi:hypothetical protein